MIITVLSLSNFKCIFSLILYIEILGNGIQNDVIACMLFSDERVGWSNVPSK